MGVVQATDAVTALDIVTLVIAVLGAVTGIAALAWSIAAHVLSGPRPKVTLLDGWTNGRGYASVPFRRFSTASKPEGFEMPMVGVQVNNAGRSPVQVTAIVVTNGSARYGEIGTATAMHPELPTLLGPGEQQTWWLDGVSVLTFLDLTDATTVFAQVDLGTGGSARSDAVSIEPRPDVA